MERGQITLPKAVREELGITQGMPLNLVVEDGTIKIKPLHTMVVDSPRVIKPTLSRKEYVKALQAMHGVLWTKEDDRAREKMRKKEKYLNW
ncbi:AbrB/MazE/SpoVT family DNA-binding domain-containing protein [Candidatus Gottesmanbacteria bacterium]|nr:AbrB/MazE/SpoVT family DNA-binding domain-containing protein [Candidatus Gottesmanbacteria bacterium]